LTKSGVALRTQIVSDIAILHQQSSSWQDLRDGTTRHTRTAAQVVTFESPDLVVEARKVGALEDDEAAGLGLVRVVWRRLTVWDLCPC